MTSKRLSSLDKIRAAGTVVIADTADFNKITRFQPSEGTTNPSLLYAAAQLPAYTSLLQAAASYARSLALSDRAGALSRAVEFLAVSFGTAIYHATGGVATEVDVACSFDTATTVAAALRLVTLYEANGVPRSSVRIKIAATWEGIQAGRVLEAEHGVRVLVTVVFGLVQALTAAEAGVECVALYVGRIGDWWRARREGEEDMGVREVRRMQRVLRARGFMTKVMAASFRTPEQIRMLAGVDLLTVAPAILEALEEESEGHEVVLVDEQGPLELTATERASYINDENAFRWAYNWDACTVEKSAEALRRFAGDTDKLKALLDELL